MPAFMLSGDEKMIPPIPLTPHLRQTKAYFTKKRAGLPSFLLRLRATSLPAGNYRNLPASTGLRVEGSLNVVETTQRQAGRPYIRSIHPGTKIKLIELLRGTPSHKP